jgi:hypothetical protein
MSVSVASGSGGSSGRNALTNAKLVGGLANNVDSGGGGKPLVSE